MRTFVWLGLCSIVGCERAPDGATPPAAAPVPPPVAKPAPAIAPRPPTPTVEAILGELTRDTDRITTILAHPVEHPRPRVTPPVVDASALPVPPTDDPKAYAAWSHDLPAAQRKRIAAFCRANPLEYHLECGGIGPLHIPMPPNLVAPMADGEVPAPRRGSRFASRQDWLESLSVAQHRYVEHACQSEDAPSSDLCGVITPLVVAFDNQPVRFATGGTFAFASGNPTASDLPTATTPWIALDRNQDGVIDRGAELFGSNTRLADGSTATNGFVALAALDSNHDGRIDVRDADFASLVLWADRDGDGRSTPDELTPLADVIVSISLADRVDLRCDERGNCEGERASFTWRDPRGGQHEGSVVDVYLPRR